MTKEGLTHFDASGAAHMVDVGEKEITLRTAEAAGSVWMLPATFRRVADRSIEKGDVLAVARIAGIMAAKRTPDLIPLCHPLPLQSVEVDFTLDEAQCRVDIRARVKVSARTGVEMEALTAVSAAALTVYDMCKAIDRGMKIGEIRLLRKEGGRSGVYQREET